MRMQPAECQNGGYRKRRRGVDMSEHMLKSNARRLLSYEHMEAASEIQKC